MIVVQAKPGTKMSESRGWASGARAAPTPNGLSTHLARKPYVNNQHLSGLVSAHGHGSCGPEPRGLWTPAAGLNEGRD